MVLWSVLFCLLLFFIVLFGGPMHRSVVIVYHEIGLAGSSRLAVETGALD